MNSYFNHIALPIFLLLEEVFPYTAARSLPLIWKILAQLGRSAFWTHTEKMRFQCVLVPFHPYYMGNYSDLQS